MSANRHGTTKCNKHNKHKQSITKHIKGIVNTTTRNEASHNTKRTTHQNGTLWQIGVSTTIRNRFDLSFTICVKIALFSSALSMRYSNPFRSFVKRWRRSKIIESDESTVSREAQEACNLQYEYRYGNTYTICRNGVHTISTTMAATQSFTCEPCAFHESHSFRWSSFRPHWMVLSPKSYSISGCWWKR